MPFPARYCGRRGALGTQHDKLPLVAPAFAEHLGLVVESVSIDTDSFGTFAGEVPRTLAPREAALAKARVAMARSGLTFGLASEGSIGSVGPFPLTVDVEVVAFVDDENGFELVESARDTGIVTASWTVTDGRVECGDLERAGFPEHGLIVRPANGFVPIHKGIHDRRALDDAVRECAAFGDVRIESDLRADHCPSRRPVIAEAARRLATRLKAECPSCGCPGWGSVDVVRGRRCADCHLPTDAPIAVVEGCPRCPTVRKGPPCRIPADPATCWNCNP